VESPRPHRAVRLGGWLDERLGLSAFAYPVPRHANTLAYTLGGITLGSFVLLVASGVYLTQFYEPSPARAHASVVEITQGDVGSVIRSVHFWLSTIFVATLVLHLIRTFVTGSFKRPREATWISGVALFAVGGGLLFTGTILKWDQEALEALEHNSEIARLFGALGFWFADDFSRSVSLLLRDYIAHVSILPTIAVFLLGAHLFLIKRHGVSPVPWGDAAQVRERARQEERHPFTTHLWRILYWTLVVLGLALVLAALRPAGIGPEAVEGIEITKPPWYFLWLYPFENWFGVKALAIVPGVLLAGLVALPFFDRGEERDPRRRRAWVALATLVVLAWGALTVYAYVTEPVAHVAG
jgi:ubiquinol-cytochrome c reductase cytochrome b subunit